MLDRVPTKPNRYAVYDENHNFLRYEYHERADEPTQEGDPLNKANLLPDDDANQATIFAILVLYRIIYYLLPLLLSGVALLIYELSLARRKKRIQRS